MKLTLVRIGTWNGLENDECVVVDGDAEPMAVLRYHVSDKDIVLSGGLWHYALVKDFAQLSNHALYNVDGATIEGFTGTIVKIGIFRRDLGL